jgi:hypothetical protein
MQRVCFLDLDGVLAPFSSVIRSRAQALDGRLVRRVARFVERHDLTVVLASTWRHEVGVGATVKLLAPSWPQAAKRIQSSTPVLHLPRGQEIAAWLRAVHDVERFVILDDADELAPLTAFHVRTDRYAGLQPKDLVKAAAVLARQRLHRG